MPQKQSQKVKGCKKCNRKKRKEEGRNSILSLFVRNKITAKDYFEKSGQKIKNV